MHFGSIWKTDGHERDRAPHRKAGVRVLSTWVLTRLSKPKKFADAPMVLRVQIVRVVGKGPYHVRGTGSQVADRGVVPCNNYLVQSISTTLRKPWYT